MSCNFVLILLNFVVNSDDVDVVKIKLNVKYYV